MGWGERVIYLSPHCHHQNDSCIMMGSDGSHFNVSVGSDGQSHKTVSTNHNLSEEKGESRRYRTKLLPLTSLTALPLGQTGSHVTAKRGHELFRRGQGGRLGVVASDASLQKTTGLLTIPDSSAPPRSVTCLRDSYNNQGIAFGTRCQFQKSISDRRTREPERHPVTTVQELSLIHI